MESCGSIIVINPELTLFPEMVLDGLNTSIIGRAAGKGLLSIEAVNIRDYAFNKHQSVDDYPYGGGAGMLMQAEPVYQAYEAIAEKVKKKPRVVYLSPQGATFSQTMAEELAKEEELVLLCGHYEGIDERVLEEIVTDTRTYKFGTDLNFTLCLNKEYDDKGQQKGDCFVVESLRDEDCFSKSRTAYTVTHIFSAPNDAKKYTNLLFLDENATIDGLPDEIKNMLDQTLLHKYKWRVQVLAYRKYCRIFLRKNFLR
jgi:hypothetical protein